MGFREDHPAAARVHARLWLALIAAVVALAAAGTASLAATDEVAPECVQATVVAEAALPAVEDCEKSAGSESDAPSSPSSDAVPGEPAYEAPQAAAEAKADVVAATPAEPAAPADPASPAKPDPDHQPGEAAEPAAPADPAEPATPAQPADPGPNAAPAVADEHGASPDTSADRAASATPKQRTASRRPATRQRAAKRKRRSARAEHAQVYFPPVSIDWLSLTPLAPPAFGSGEATRFPGPLFLLPIYQAAAVQYRIPWEVLAAINEIETDFGSNVSVSSAGAMGWMQFMPATWAAFGVDANRDGQKNLNDPVDAIFSAARYLRASGAARDLPRAIFAYNHANWYVERVLRRAQEIGDLPEDLLATLVAEGRTQASAIRRATGSPGLLDPDHEAKTIGRVLLLDDERLREHVLADERIEIYGCGREDVATGIVDRRVLETLEFLASRKLRPAVTSLRCGHGYYTSAGSVSEHSYGAAMDIARVNGTPILGHQGEGSVTDETIRALLELRGSLRPHQIISLMTFTGASNALAMSDHDDHVHVGFAPLRNLEESR